MPCLSPLKGYRSTKAGKTGKYGVVFSKDSAYTDLPVDVPCGQCRWCRLERARVWSIRCMNESQLHKENWFLTLTYNDKFLPENKTLVKKDLQNFFKRLRKKHKFRYYACGEYGDENERPHYHVIIFGLELTDKILHTNNNGFNIYISPYLEKVWGMGFVVIGNVTFDSCSYVARYIMKKQLGKNAKEHYKRIGKIPEYNVMSRKPGIGHDWYKKYWRDIYSSENKGTFNVDGRKTKPPRYYEEIFKKESPEYHEKIKRMRRNLAISREDDNTPERLRVKENVLESRCKKQLRRQL